jgi:hypothetical protein
VGSRGWASQIQGTTTPQFNLQNASSSSSSHANPEVSAFGLSSACTQPLEQIMGSLFSSSATAWGHPSSRSCLIFQCQLSQCSFSHLCCTLLFLSARLLSGSLALGIVSAFWHDPLYMLHTAHTQESKKKRGKDDVSSSKGCWYHFWQFLSSVSSSFDDGSCF